MNVLLASMNTTNFEETSETGVQRTEGKMINLSIETKVAIAVATGLLMLIVGAMAQG